MGTRPKIIILTPVRNEAWVLPAFLKAASLWADYIIIADQNSNDGSREIAESFSKVILVDNPRKDMHQARTRKLLFDEAMKIEGDKILFALDADEFLSGDFMHTDDWKSIMNSVPGDVFLFRWMNLTEDKNKYTSFVPYYWAFHVPKVLEGTFPDNFIHEWRLPWPHEDVLHQRYICNQISFVHFARVNVKRQMNKECFYMLSTLASDKNTSAISIYRMYFPAQAQLFDVPNETYCFYEKNGLDLWEYINLTDGGEHYIDVVKSLLNQYGARYFEKVDIWDTELVKSLDIHDPRSTKYKVLHLYLRKTRKYANCYVVRIMDKILRKLRF